MDGRILVVDDDRDMCELLHDDLSTRNFDVTWYTSGADAFDALQKTNVDVVVTDVNMPEMDGIEFCDRVVSNWPDVPVIVFTAFGNMDMAVEAIRAGAYDFITKPFEMDILALMLERALKHHILQEQVKTLSEAIDGARHFYPMIGESPPMLAFIDQLKRIADSEISVLVTGESGTGKELVARGLHRQSSRSQKPFVAINCAALPENLLESELFGHERGAFTDARTARKGLIMQAHGGTLFFDEIGDFPLTLQPKLLRALEEREIRPVGGNQEIPFDVRVIAATNRDLEVAIEEGRFREDLYFRINVIQLELPPLRTRSGDILLLAQHFIEQFAKRAGKAVKGLGEPVADKLLAYSWPGNVRELRNAMERAVALTLYEQITVEDLPEKIRAYHSTDIVIGGENPSELITMEALEQQYILHVFKAVGGNRTLAARILGFDRKTLYRKMQRYGLAEDDIDI